MGATDKAELRACIGIFPDYRVFPLNAGKLLIVYDIYLRILTDEFFSLKLCFGRKVIDVVKTYRAV